MARNNLNSNARLQARKKAAATAIGTEKIPNVTIMVKKAHAACRSNMLRSEYRGGGCRS
jgi:hypothetical protein